MKVFISILLLITSFFSLAIDTVSGSKSAYQYDNLQKLTVAPEGYSPFYINHIGRHGSRYISKPKYEVITHQVLQLAKQQKQLTPAGESLLIQMDKIAILNKDNYGALTELGKRDIEKIAQRMLNHFPDVFQGNHIEILSTTSPRAIASAKAFLQPFTSLYTNLEVKQQPSNAEVLLRFFEYSPAYTEYKESKSVKNFVKSLGKSEQTGQFSQNIAQKIFTQKFITQLDKGIKGIDKDKINTNEFAIALFAVYQELLSFTPEVIDANQLNFDAYLTPAEKQWLTTVITAKNYLQIGPAFDKNGIQIKIAAPLVWEIIHSSDKAISSKTIDANLRFAHAETISPLATLLEIEGTTNITDTIEHYPSYWQAEKIIPMGANIQFIFYRSEDENQPILIKVLLNERETHLPIFTNKYPYYNWSDVKRFYTEKLLSLGLTDDEDPIKLLKNLK